LPPRDSHPSFWPITQNYLHSPIFIYLIIILSLNLSACLESAATDTSLSSSTSNALDEGVGNIANTPTIKSVITIDNIIAETTETIYPLLSSTETTEPSSVTIDRAPSVNTIASINEKHLDIIKTNSDEAYADQDFYVKFGKIAAEAFNKAEIQEITTPQTFELTDSYGIKMLVEVQKDPENTEYIRMAFRSEDLSKVYALTSSYFADKSKIPTKGIFIFISPTYYEEGSAKDYTAVTSFAYDTTDPNNSVISFKKLRFISETNSFQPKQFFYQCNQSEKTCNSELHTLAKQSLDTPDNAQYTKYLFTWHEDTPWMCWNTTRTLEDNSMFVTAPKLSHLLTYNTSPNSCALSEDLYWANNVFTEDDFITTTLIDESISKELSDIGPNDIDPWLTGSSFY